MALQSYALRITGMQEYANQCRKCTVQKLHVHHCHAYISASVLELRVKSAAMSGC